MVQYSWAWIFLRRGPASWAKPRNMLFPIQQLNHKSKENRFIVKGHCTVCQWREGSDVQLTVHTVHNCTQKQDATFILVTVAAALEASPLFQAM